MTKHAFFQKQFSAIRTAFALLMIIVISLAAFRCDSRNMGVDERLSGHWLGSINIHEYELDLILHLSLAGFGRLQGTFECPQEGFRDVEFKLIEFERSRFKLWIEPSGTIIEGRLDDTGNLIRGYWKQNIRELQIELHRADSLFVVRPGWRYKQPPRLNDGWEVAGLGEANLDPAMIDSLITGVRAGKFKRIDSILIARHGRLVLEEYIRDYYGRDYLHNVTSVTKSVMSALVGIALEGGLIDSLSAPLVSYFPSWDNELSWTGPKLSLDIRHLLTMSSGLDCANHEPESAGHPDKMFQSADWVGFCLDLPMASARPGERFAYCECNAMIIGEVLRRVAGEPIPGFARDHLFQPLGIQDCRWTYSPRGKALTGTGLHLRSRDMAKLGQLYLSGGSWNGEQILPPDWIDQSWQERFDTGPLGGYGYFWWCEQLPHGSNRLTAWSATGNGGQKITVIPELDMVVVLTAAAFNKPYALNQAREILNGYILPAAN